jgi:hypothetical protein
MRINDAFPSAYLKASDFEHDTIVTIKGVTIEDIGQGHKKEPKAIVHFNEFDKGLVLNVTNKNAIEGLYGGETDDWVGKPITLFPTEVEFAGEQVMAIRVRLRKPNAPTVQTPPSAEIANARKLALDEFGKHAKGTSEEKRAEWQKLLKRTIPGRDANGFTVTDWERVRLAAAPDNPLEGAEEVDMSEVPF